MNALIEDLKIKVLELVARDRMEDAFKFLYKEIREHTEFYKTVTLLEGRFSKYQKDEIGGLLNIDDKEVAINKIRKSFLDLMNSIQIDDLKKKAEEEKENIQEPDFFTRAIASKLPVSTNSKAFKSTYNSSLFILLFSFAAIVVAYLVYRNPEYDEGFVLFFKNLPVNNSDLIHPLSLVSFSIMIAFTASFILYFIKIDKFNYRILLSLAIGLNYLSIVCLVGIMPLFHSFLKDLFGITIARIPCIVFAGIILLFIFFEIRGVLQLLKYYLRRGYIVDALFEIILILLYILASSLLFIISVAVFNNI